MDTKVKAFWETCSLEYAHNEIRKHLNNYESLTRFWELNFLKLIEFRGKRILDYGIGGGYLGKYLFDTRGIQSYIGVDIAERSLTKAKEILAPQKNTEFYLTDQYYSDYKGPIDIFICQAVIQHFYSLDYLKRFLLKIEEIGPSTVMLQITHSAKTVINTTYKNENDVARACYTNKDFLLQFLPSYRLEYAGDVLRNNYQFLIFTKR
jgi:2-polyprenyl-3-methyl-5-hydroxy-6-metoxy-1,4-benzoquinol methylase